MKGTGKFLACLLGAIALAVTGFGCEWKGHIDGSSSESERVESGEHTPDDSGENGALETPEAPETPDGGENVGGNNGTENGGEALTKYTVTFDTKGGTEIAAQIVEGGKCATAPTPPQKPAKVNTGYRTDYEFSHWTLDGEKFDFSTPIVGDVTLVANWIQWLTKI